MHFVGLDLAWGEKNNTGVAVVDSDGRLLHVGAAHDDASIEAAVEPYVSGDCLVAIDAPLIVRNPTGSRPCETALNRDFHGFEAGAHPANTANPAFKIPAAPASRPHSRSTWIPRRVRRAGRSRCIRTRRPSRCSVWRRP